MDQKQYEAWSTTRTKGQSYFVWVYGVLVWGIVTGILWCIFMAYIMPSEHIYLRPILALIIFPVGGYFWGKWVWHKTEQKYNAYKGEDENLIEGEQE